MDRRTFVGVVAGVAFAAFMYRLDTYIVNISLPTMARYFHTGTSQISLVILAYVLAITSTLLLFGKLADRIGLRKVFVAGYGLFLLGSLLCGISPSLWMLIAARAVQGVGGAMFAAAGLALIPRLVPEKRTGEAMGFLSTASALGLSVGAPLGGLITGLLSWRWIFLVNLPVGAVACWFALRRIPNIPPVAMSTARTPFDVSGAVVSLLGLSALVFGVSMSEEWGWTSPAILSSIIIGVALLVALPRLERRQADPLVNLSVLRSPSFVFSLLTALCGFLCLAGNGFLLPFYLEQLERFPPEQAGLVMAVSSVMTMCVAPWAGKLTVRIHPGKLCGAALLWITLSFLLLAALLPVCGIAGLIAYLAVYGGAMGFFVAPAMQLVMMRAPVDQRGEVSGEFQTMGSLGCILGVCLFETAFSRVVASGNTAGWPHHVTASPDLLLTGFRAGFLAGALVSAAGVIFAWKASRTATRPCPEGLVR